MKEWIKKNVLFMLLVAAGLVAAVVILAGRSQVEREGRTFDLVMDYSSLEGMAKQSEEKNGPDLDYWLAFFRRQGIRNLALTEVSVKNLSETAGNGIYAMTLGAAKGSFGWEVRFPADIAEKLRENENVNDALVISEDPEMFRWIVENFEKRTENVPHEVIHEDGVGYLFIYQDENKVAGVKWLDMPLGFEPEKLEKVLRYGYTLTPRTMAVSGVNGERYAQVVFEEFSGYGCPYWLNAGGKIAGYDEDEEEAEADLLSYLRENQAALTVIENSDQSRNLFVTGLRKAVEDSGYNVVRVFTMWNYIQNAYGKYDYEGPEEVVNALYRAIYERGCRLIYYRMMLETDSASVFIIEPEAYEKQISMLTERMAGLGYRFDTVRPLRAYEPASLLRFLVALGAIAAAIMLLELFVPLGALWRFLLLALGAVGVAAAMYVMPNTYKLVLNIASGIVLPSLAAVGVNRYLAGTEKLYKPKTPLGRILLNALAVLLCAALVSLIGAVYSAAALSETTYMIELELYRAVKVMQLVPLGVFLLSAIQIDVWEKKMGRIDAKDKKERGMQRLMRRQKIGKLLDTSVTVRHVVKTVIFAAVLAAFAAVGTYYIARTGNTEGVSSLELRFRNFLENTLLARPRTKEFLVGYPCLMLMAWAHRRSLRFLPVAFGAGAVIGALVSVVNTFLHIRTPVFISTVRVLTALIPGVVLGVVAVLLAEGILRLVRKLREKKRMKHV